ncbi:DUF3772 domain-containing protein [Paracoccus sp. (in: a-proteobacteria)]|uniref:DUF3772 domain-containing protein n=1 Tax=Paracoccus sp. TaxID=267 RepID=UPI003A8B13F2
MSRILFAVLLAALMLVAAPLYAQQGQGQAINYDTWNKVATEAENLASQEYATTEQLTQTRARIVEWRSRFQNAQNVNAGRIDSVKNQIDALGPPPAEGQNESADVAARRSQLQDELSKLQAPRLNAVEAFSRADAIVKEIDGVTTERQAIALAHLSPSPLLPKNWAQASEDTLKLIAGTMTETTTRSTDKDIWKQMQPHLPRVTAYLFAAMLLLTYGSQWVRALPSRMSARASEHSRAVVGFIVSLSQIVIPMLGLYLLISAMMVTEIPGPWTRPYWDAWPMAGLIIFSGSWLARQLFPRRSIAYDTLHMASELRRPARRMVHALAALMAFHHLMSKAALPLSGLYERVGDPQERIPLALSDGTVAVAHYCIIILTALALYRLGTVLRRLDTEGSKAALLYRQRVLAIAGRLSRLVVVVVVTIGGIGYINLANGLLWPWMLTLALIGMLILLQDFVADLFNMVKRGQEGARDGLAPLLIGFALLILSLPVFLMIWGARLTDLAELWTTFAQGVSLGGIHISPGSVLTFLIIFAIGYSLTRALQSALRISILPKTKLDPGGQNALVSGLGYVGIFLAAVVAVTWAGIDLSSLAIVAGALSVGIGFGLQNIVSNFVSGIILLIERPVSVGDWISAGGQQGIVKRISVRSTQVETFDKTEVIVPNSDLISQPVTNWTRHNHKGRIIVPVGVAYGTDTRKVERILREIVEDQPLVTIDPPPAVLFRAFGADSLDFEIRAVLSDVTAGLSTTSEINHQIAERFTAEGIEIPFAQRDIWLRNPEVLHANGSGHAARPSTAVDHEKPVPARNDPRIAFDDAGDGDGGDGDR